MWELRIARLPLTDDEGGLDVDTFTPLLDPMVWSS